MQKLFLKRINRAFILDIEFPQVKIDCVPILRVNSVAPILSIRELSHSCKSGIFQIHKTNLYQIDLNKDNNFRTLVKSV